MAQKTTHTSDEVQSEIQRTVSQIRAAVSNASAPPELVEIGTESIDVMEAIAKLLDAGAMSAYEADASAVKILTDYISRMEELQRRLDAVTAKLSGAVKA